MKNVILILDSDTLTLKRLRNTLSGAGYNLMTATNLATAREIMKQVDISYVLAEPDFFSGLSNYPLKSIDGFKIDN